MTTTSQRPAPVTELIPQRRLPASMVALAVFLVSLFALIVLVTVFAVLNDETPEAPALKDFPLPAGVELVGSMSTCTDQACDGLGIALTAADGGDVSGRLAMAWRETGWTSRPCVDSGKMCFASGDLRLSVSVWADVDPVTVPTLLESIEERGLDPNEVVFVHYYRCGPIYPCE